LGGLARHRISSAIYCYVDNPNGGEAEYTCDSDYLDDNWIPRVWNWKFGALMWAHERAEIFGKIGENWDMRLDPEGRSLEGVPYGPQVWAPSALLWVLETRLKSFSAKGD